MACVCTHLGGVVPAGRTHLKNLHTNQHRSPAGNLEDCRILQRKSEACHPVLSETEQANSGLCEWYGMGTCLFISPCFKSSRPHVEGITILSDNSLHSQSSQQSLTPCVCGLAASVLILDVGVV